MLQYKAWPHRGCRSSASALLCFALTLGCLACGQTADKASRKEFAVEGPPGHYVIVSPGVSTEMPAAMLKPMAGHVLSTELDTLKVDYRLEGEKVTATVYALSAPRTDPDRYADSKKYLVGFHSALLGQTFTLNELEQFGYEPIVYTIVTARPPVPTQPVVISKVPSIRIEVAGENRAYYKLVLKNISAKDIIAYALGDRRSFESSDWYDANRPSFSAGSFIERQAAIKSPIVVAAAVFSDGSYEGDSDLACLLYARQVGYARQRKRVEASIDRIVRDRALDESSKIANIQMELMKLPQEPDADMVRKMRREYPALDAKLVMRDLALGLEEAKRGIWGSLYGFQHQSGEYPRSSARAPVAYWWQNQPAVRDVFYLGTPKR